MRAPPPPRPDVERVSSLRILGVTVNDKLTAVDHVTTLLSSSSSLMYAMRVRARRPRHFMSFFVPQSFLGFSTRHQRGWECVRLLIARLELLLRRAKWFGYCAGDVPTVADLFNFADDDFCHRIKTNSNHVLQPYLPDKTDIPFSLRTHSHNMTLINKTKFLSDADFLIRMLYKYLY